MNRNEQRDKIKRQMWFWAALAILGWAGGFSIMIIGNQIATTIIGCIMFTFGVGAAVYAVMLGLKL